MACPSRRFLPISSHVFSSSPLLLIEPKRIACYITSCSTPSAAREFDVAGSYFGASSRVLWRKNDCIEIVGREKARSWEACGSLCLGFGQCVLRFSKPTAASSYPSFTRPSPRASRQNLWPKPLGGAKRKHRWLVPGRPRFMTCTMCRWVVPNTLRFGAMDAVVESNPLCSISFLLFSIFFKIVKFLYLPCKCPFFSLFK